MNYHKYKRLKSSDKPKPKVEQPDPDGLIRLNKYIANSGVMFTKRSGYFD